MDQKGSLIIANTQNDHWKGAWKFAWSDGYS